MVGNIKDQIVGSSVASTTKPRAAPRVRIAAMPSGMEAWRNPFVREKTRTRVPGGALPTEHPTGTALEGCWP